MTVRKWYTYHDKRIHELLESSLSMEEKARRALDRKHPNKTWGETIADKMRRKGLTREEAIADIYETATKPNPEVNRKLGLE